MVERSILYVFLAFDLATAFDHQPAPQAHADIAGQTTLPPLLTSPSSNPPLLHTSPAMVDEAKPTAAQLNATNAPAPSSRTAASAGRARHRAVLQEEDATKLQFGGASVKSSQQSRGECRGDHHGRELGAGVVRHCADDTRVRRRRSFNHRRSPDDPADLALGARRPATT